MTPHRRCVIATTLVGELFSIQQIPSEDKRVTFYGELEQFLTDHDAYPGHQVMRVSPKDDQDLFDCLSDAMASLAPPGHYFGEARHDSGIFGFWPVPENYWEVHP